MKAKSAKGQAPAASNGQTGAAAKQAQKMKAIGGEAGGNPAEVRTPRQSMETFNNHLQLFTYNLA